MSIDTFLSHVKGVRKAGKRAWLCSCPSHADSSPSLKVTHAEDGRVLIHCFAGCSPGEVLGAVGLSMEDLFEEPLYHRGKQLKRGIYPRDVLIALKTEIMIVMISSFDLRKGKALSEVDQERLGLAYERLAEAIELAGVA